MLKAIKTPRLVLPALVLGAGLSLAATAQTGTTGTAPGGSKPAAAAAAKSVSIEDVEFIRKAAMGGMAEVQLGNLAQQKAAHVDVKQFGTRMVEDHGKVNEALKRIAGAKGIDLPKALDKKHKSDVERLGKLAGAEFDRAYMQLMVDDHKKDVADFRKASTAARDAEVKAFAADTLPVLQEHLQLAQKTQDALKSKPPAAAAAAKPREKKGGC